MDEKLDSWHKNGERWADFENLCCEFTTKIAELSKQKDRKSNAPPRWKRAPAAVDFKKEASKIQKLYAATKKKAIKRIQCPIDVSGIANHIEKVFSKQAFDQEKCYSNFPMYDSWPNDLMKNFSNPFCEQDVKYVLHRAPNSAPGSDYIKYSDFKALDKDGARFKKHNLSMMWPDMANAFGSISHELILPMLNKLGFPSFFNDIVGDFYLDSKTSFQINNKESREEFCGTLRPNLASMVIKNSMKLL
uniref:Reverse transcriptase domain-containing protein n=1 Tax=Romanomermis culicivorax TaxID=13658 RepID=A0A915JHX0_ROMCU